MIDDRLATPPHIILRDDKQSYPAEGQCDACSAGVAVTLAHRPITSQYILSAPIVLELGDGYSVVGGPQTWDGVLALNRSALMLAQHFDRPRRLSSVNADWRRAWGEPAIRETLTQMVSLGLLVPYGCAAPAFVETPRILAAWLHLTSACQLACDYCYNSRSGGEMSAEVGRLAIDAVFRSTLAHNFAAVKFKYAGGEPTLRFPLVVELHRYATELAQRHGLGLDGVVLSNGVEIRPQVIETMQSLGLRLAISLDGLGSYHDCQRHFSNGRGSFEAVAHTIDQALSIGLVPDISITVSGRNADGLPELMTWVLERNLPFSLNFYRENAQSASQTDLRLEEERIIAGMLAAYKAIEERMPERCLLASLADRANLATPHLRTCSVGHSYLVTDCQGRVAKCQMGIERAVTNVEADDPLAFVRADKIGIQNLPVNEKEECCDCQWRYWCAGGCPLATYRVTGRYDAKSPNCNIYKALYPEVIKLEGLRLLKYANEST